MRKEKVLTSQETMQDGHATSVPKADGSPGHATHRSLDVDAVEAVYDDKASKVTPIEQGYLDDAATISEEANQAFPPIFSRDEGLVGPTSKDGSPAADVTSHRRQEGKVAVRVSALLDETH